MIAEFWFGVAPVIYLVTVVLVLLGALGFALALCRMGAINEEPLIEREVGSRSRPRGDVTVQPLDGTEFPGLERWGDDLLTATRREASR